MLSMNYKPKFFRVVLKGRKRRIAKVSVARGVVRRTGRGMGTTNLSTSLVAVSYRGLGFPSRAFSVIVYEGVA